MNQLIFRNILSHLFVTTLPSFGELSYSVINVTSSKGYFFIVNGVSTASVSFL